MVYNVRKAMASKITHKEDNMILKFNDYYDKVKACFLGKNIGGTVGAPFEGVTAINNVDFYTHDISTGALPNDDLDLQLVWLLAAEKFGKTVNSAILADFWAYKIVAHWAEYGKGKINLRSGLIPPISGAYDNYMKDSNGAWIRSEIWACLCPGRPDLAAKYALEDASVDHADEGVYAEVFTAALESAAFVENDYEKLINIALSYIPKDCAVEKAIRLVQRCKAEGKTWKEARKAVMTEVPGAFAHRVDENLPEEDRTPRGPQGFDAPSNLGIMMIGWYYGEGDFGKTLCTAVNCGEDTDCTAATLGSIWGILHGTKGIPAKWLDPIGDEIKTLSLDRTHELFKICGTVSELTERVTNLMPAFMTECVNLHGESGVEITTSEGDSLYDVGYPFGGCCHRCFKDELSLKNGNTVTVKSPFYYAYLTYNKGIEISEGVETEIELSFRARYRQGWIDAKLYAPEDWEILPSRELSLPIDYGMDNYKKFTVRIIPHNLKKGRYEFPIELILGEARLPKYLPVAFIVR